MAKTIEQHLVDSFTPEQLELLRRLSAMEWDDEATWYPIVLSELGAGLEVRRKDLKPGNPLRYRLNDKPDGYNKEFTVDFGFWPFKV